MDISCLLSAFLFFVANLQYLILYFKEYNRDGFDYDQWRALSPAYIQEEWDFRIAHKGLHISAGLCNALAWLAFSFPILHLAWILSVKGTRATGLHVSIAVLALTGAFTEWMSRFLWIGSNLTTQFLAESFNLDNWIPGGDADGGDGIGWRVLEVAHITTIGLIWFVDALEWILIALIMLLVYASLRGFRNSSTHNLYVPPGGTSDQAVPIFGGCQHNLCLFVALLSVLDFVAEILRIDGFRLFGQVPFWYAIVNRLLFIPTWLVLLGRRLPLAASKLQQMGGGAGAFGGPSSANENRSGVM